MSKRKVVSVLFTGMTTMAATGINFTGAAAATTHTWQLTPAGKDNAIAAAKVTHIAPTETATGSIVTYSGGGLPNNVIACQQGSHTGLATPYTRIVNTCSDVRADVSACTSLVCTALIVCPGQSKTTGEAYSLKSAIDVLPASSTFC
jgi:hypothetical protein